MPCHSLFICLIMCINYIAVGNAADRTLIHVVQHKNETFVTCRIINYIYLFFPTLYKYFLNKGLMLLYYVTTYDLFTSVSFSCFAIMTLCVCVCVCANYQEYF